MREALAAIVDRLLNLRHVGLLPVGALVGVVGLMGLHVGSLVRVVGLLDVRLLGRGLRSLLPVGLLRLLGAHVVLSGIGLLGIGLLRCLAVGLLRCLAVGLLRCLAKGCPTRGGNGSGPCSTCSLGALYRHLLGRRRIVVGCVARIRLLRRLLPLCRWC